MPPAQWRWWTAILVYFGGAILAGVVSVWLVQGIPAGPTRTLAFDMFAEVIPVGALLIWLRFSHKGWPRVIGYPAWARWPREAFVGVFSGFAIYIAASLVVYPAVTWFFDQVSGHPAEPPQQLPSHLAGPNVFLSVLFAIAIAPVCEEFFFRGCVFTAIRARRRFLVAGLGSALTFGLAHWSGVGPLATQFFLVPIMFCVGFALAYVYERRKNIIASTFAHAAFNTVGILYILHVLH
jgi:membrane protease YdiL (CAAX protease family)